MVQRIIFGASGGEPWISDGTEAGTTRLKDIHPFGSSDPSHFTVAGNRVFFFADDNINGFTLWVTDGTEAGTRSVTGGIAGLTGVFTPLSAYEDRLLFIRNNGVLGSELWISDGTTEGTAKLRDFANGTVSDLTHFDNKIYFSASDPDGTQGLWSTDGTAAGTNLVAELRTRPSGITAFDNRLFFSADNDPAINRELWISDGTTVGTGLFADLSASNSSDPHDFVVAGDRMFFIASISNPSPAPTGAELWVSDGTVPGTYMVKDIVPGISSPGIVELTAFGDKVIFRANDGVNGQEIWVSDGTADGTFQLRDIFPGATGSGPSGFTVLGDKVIFRASDGVHTYLGGALWITDGTPEGTVLLKGEIGPQILPAGEVDKLGVVIGDKLYFAAFRGDTAATFTGVELWSTDGTPEGTTLVKDILPGVGSSLPQWLTVFDEGRVNAAPSAVTLANKTTMIAENTATTSRIKVADIVVTDDGLGTNALSVTGTDAARFEIVGTVLYIKPGQTLDFETNASYSVAVQVNDASVGGSPDVISAIYSLAIGNVSPETLTGDAAANMLIGGIDRDIISGLGGNDTLNGGAGNDTLIGGTGNDIYIVNAGDNITEFVGQGTADRVRTVATFALAAGANIEFLETTNAALTTKLNLTGNEIAQAVTGNAGINALSGLGGNDTLRGESGHDTIYGGIGNDNAYGGTGNDKLYGQAGNDTLRGDAGVDWLAGAAGRDVLYGGADRDILDFNSLADSRGSTRDFLADFLRRVDDIDVSTIDANMKLAGNQRFTFIGDKTFTKKAGELHYVKSGSNVRVEGDVNGDAKADFAIDVKGTAALTSGDFIL